jgi:hypothetical protein
MNMHAFHGAHAFTRAHKAAARHARRGNLALADKWLKIAERHERLLHRLQQLQLTDLKLVTFREEQRVFRRMIRTGELKPDAEKLRVVKQG